MELNPTFYNLIKLVFLSIFIFWIALLPMVTMGQSYNYQIVRGDNVVGKMVAKKLIKGDSILYDIYSETEIKVLFTIRVEYKMDEFFFKGKLIDGHVLSTLNGSTQKESRIAKKEKGYRAEVDSDLFYLKDEKITFSIPELYFKEPVGMTKVFSQQFADYLYFVKLGEHQYELSSDDGINTYTYKDGKCVEVKVARSYITFLIKIVE